jgi:L-erythro-3,5-diaminohexanoate dehydrogenase
LNAEPNIIHEEEALIQVDELMLDSTSMRQLREQSHTPEGCSEELINSIMNIVRRRGKCHNPVTNSGGVLIGRLKDKGKEFQHENVPIGSVVSPLGSLSTIPLHINKICDVKGDRVYVKCGTAVVFSTSVLCQIPTDLGKDLALSCIDIASIVPQLDRVFSNIMDQFKRCRYSRKLRVLVIGCGKAGLTALQMISNFKSSFEGDIETVAVDYSQSNIDYVRKHNLADNCFKHDARDPREMFNVCGSEGFDFVVNVVNVTGTETSTVLCTRSGGTAFWFSMASQFDRVALSPDALYRDIISLVGNGYAVNQAEMIFELIRQHSALRVYFEAH